MRFGVSADDQNTVAEETRQTRQVVVPGGEYLVGIPPTSVENLNAVDGSGNPMARFILGLHDPFDPRVDRWIG